MEHSTFQPDDNQPRRGKQNKQSRNNKQSDRKGGRCAPLHSQPHGASSDAVDDDASSRHNTIDDVDDNDVAGATDDTTPDYSLDGLPELTEAGHIFITTYINSNYNLAKAAKAANLSTDEIHLFTASPHIQAHLEAHFNFLHATTQCMATKSRQFVQQRLETLIENCDDPKEERILLQTLQRATSANITSLPRHARTSADSPQGGVGDAQRIAGGGYPSANPSAPSSSPDASTPSSSDTSCLRGSMPSCLSSPRIIPDTHKPKPTDNGKQTFLRLLLAVQQSSQDEGPRIIAEFLEHNAEINGQRIPTSNDEECFKAVRTTAVPGLIQLRQAWNYSGSELAKESRETHQATVIVDAEPIKVTMELTKAPLNDPASRDPNRWLISKLDLAPAGKWPENQRRPFGRTSPLDTC